MSSYWPSVCNKLDFKDLSFESWGLISFLFEFARLQNVEDFILHSWICKVFVIFYIRHVQPAHWQKPRCCRIDSVPFAVDWHQSTNEGLGIGYGPMELGYSKSRSSSKGSNHEDKRGSGNSVYVLTQYTDLIYFICFMLQGQFQAFNFLGKINL